MQTKVRSEKETWQLIKICVAQGCAQAVDERNMNGL
jgi:hypothetical protein